MLGHTLPNARQVIKLLFIGLLVFVSVACELTWYLSIVDLKDPQHPLMCF